MKTNSRFLRTVASAGLVVCSGAAVLGITSFASAKTSQNPVQVVAATDSDAQSEARPNPVATAATALGMSEADLLAELQAGKSIADVAKDRNVDIEKVVAALKAEFAAHLAEEVKSGEHTQAEADAELAEFDTRVVEMLNRAGGPRMGHDGHGGKGGHRGKGAPFASADLAKVLTLTEAELQTELRSGKSLAAIAEAQGVDIDDVKKVLVAGFTAHLAEEVKSGEHTQAEADAKLAKFTANLDAMVNSTGPMGGRHGRDDHGHGDIGGMDSNGQPTGGATNLPDISNLSV